MNKKPLYEEVAEKLISALEKGTSPFQKPWSNDNRLFEFPYNPVTNKPYKGINTWWLALQNESDPRWMTFKQAQSQGWSIAKGAKAKDIVFFSHTTERLKLDENKKPILDKDGNKIKVTVLLDKPIITTAKVFNAKDVVGIPPIELKEKFEWKDDKALNKLIKNSGAKISHGGNEAFYAPNSDRIQMPQKQQFPKAENYYSVLLHEMAHWTGHHQRLNRSLSGGFGSVEYAKEELRAEIASLMIESQFGLPHDFDRHASYVNSWIKVLKNDPIEIFRASADAQKITDYVLDFQHKKAVKQSVKTEAETLKLNDQIKYNDTLYAVKGLLPNKRLQLTDLKSGQSFVVHPDDKLYSSLVKAKTEEIKPSKSQSTEILTSPSHDQSNEHDTGFKLKR